jgi:uncharacterized protein with PIN domain
MSYKTYKLKVSTRDKRFKNRSIKIYSYSDNADEWEDEWETEEILIPDTEVVCDFCNTNVYNEKVETFGYLIYTSMEDVRMDRPYMFCCEKCTEKYWKYSKPIYKLGERINGERGVV